MRARSTIGLVAGLLAGVVVLLDATTVSARSQVDLAWTAREVFPVALRFVRVDRNCKLTDRDENAGFIVFECPDEAAGGKATKRGALELIPTDGNRAVRVQVTLSGEPRYLELRFLELLERKVREERGAPLPARPSRDVPDGGS